MNETSYTDMMNNLSSYLDKYCGLNQENAQNANGTVEDLLTDLIHMDAPRDEKQNGGVLIDDVMTNLTGGSVGGKKKKQAGQDIVEIAFKDVDMNLLEGGAMDSENEEMKGGVNPGGKKDTSSSDEDIDEFNNDEEEDNMISEQTEGDKSSNMYAQFLQRYNDVELSQTMHGGDNKDITTNGKIHILPMFPYLLRY